MRTITLHAVFPGDEAGYRVLDQLTDRGYATELSRLRSGQLVLIVTTDARLRAEVEGLVWMQDGRVLSEATARGRRDEAVIG